MGELWNQIKSNRAFLQQLRLLQRKVLQSKCVLSRQNIIDCDEADDCTSEILKKHVTIRPIDHKRQGRHAARVEIIADHDWCTRDCRCVACGIWYSK